jgi:hypothetical protein
VTPSSKDIPPNGRARRRLLAVGAALPVASWVNAQARLPNSVPGSTRLALVLGQSDYPAGEDLPPIPKNVHDLTAALGRRGFKVRDAIDVPPEAALALIEEFARDVAKADDDAVVLFYFSGHGIQVDAKNFLVGSGVNIKGDTPAVVKGSIELFGNVIQKLPKEAAGMRIAIIDACRTDVMGALRVDDGLNQVEAPQGCLIAFSTGAGRPAISPMSANQYTFYTAALIKALDNASDDINFSELFRMVRLDVRETMLQYPVPAIRRLAQNPFIAENLRHEVLVVESTGLPPTSAGQSGDEALRLASEQADWTALQAMVWPPEVASTCEQFLQKYPSGRYVQNARVLMAGARDAAEMLQRRDVRLYRAAFEPAADWSEERRSEVLKAARGDKDAAARIARWYSDADSGVQRGRYEGWLQYAARLGNGIASYELALYYRKNNQAQQASQFEARAKELGYNPPASLTQQRK